MRTSTKARNAARLALVTATAASTLAVSGAAEAADATAVGTCTSMYASVLLVGSPGPELLSHLYNRYTNGGCTGAETGYVVGSNVEYIPPAPCHPYGTGSPSCDAPTVALGGGYPYTLVFHYVITIGDSVKTGSVSIVEGNSVDIHFA